MTYQPLHHKYRPQTFSHLVGQEAIATTLTNALHQQRIAPAYLFTGARGTGKTSSARILAKSLNCLKSHVPTDHPCGVCEVCQAIANGSALDVIEIDAASNTGVDNIRELIERAQFAPVQCRYKVYVIDEVHMLSNAAFNALLKTLEEPPDRVVFVLATTDPQRVLPTIISRCQRFDFRRIPLDAMVKHLTMITKQESISITEDAVTLVAQISQGGLRDAESLLDQLSLLAGEVTVEKVWDLVGSVPERDLLALLEAIAQDNPEVLLDCTRRLMDRGREPLIVLQNLASFYRDLLIAKTAPDRSDLVAITPPTWAALCQFAQTLDTSTILLGQQHLRSCEVQLKSTTQPRLWLEVTLMGLLPSAIAQPTHNSSSATVIVNKQSSNGQSLSSQTSNQIQRDRGQVSSSAQTTATPVPPVAESRPVPSSNSPSIPSNPTPASPIEQPDQEVEELLEAAVEEEVSASLPINDSPKMTVNLNQIWQDTLKQVQPYSTQMLLRQQGCLLVLTDQEARIGVNAQWFPTAKLKVTNLEAAFEKSLKRKVQILLEIAAPEEIKAAREQSASTGGTTPPPTRSLGAPPPSFPQAQNYHSPPDPRPSTEPESWSQPTPSIDPPQPPDALNPPSANSSIDPWQEEDEVTRAAKRLAEFFAGKVVDMTDDNETVAAIEDLAAVEATALPDEPDSDDIEEKPPTTKWSNQEEDELEDDDIPF